MADIGSINNGMLGIRRGLEGLRNTADDIASAGQMDAQNPAGTARSLVDLIGHRTQVQASAEVIKTANDLLGTLFDDKA